MICINYKDQVDEVAAQGQATEQKLQAMTETAATLQDELQKANKKIEQLQDAIVKAKVEESKAKATARETRNQVTSTWQLRVGQVQQEMQGKIDRLTREIQPDKDTIQAQKTTLDEKKKEFQTLEKTYRETTKTLSDLTFNHDLLVGQSNRLKSLIEEKDKSIADLKKSLETYDQEQHITKRLLANCTLEGKKYEYHGKEIAFKQSQHDAQKKDQAQHTKFNLEQQSKDKDIERQNTKRAFEQSTRGSHIQTIANDTRATQAGHFPAMNTNLQAQPKVAGYNPSANVPLMGT